MNKVKKGDEVAVISGKFKGKTAKVLAVNPNKNTAILEKLNIVKKHQKPTQNTVGGIVDKAMPIHQSKLMVQCKYCKAPTKVKFVVVDHVKYRKCSTCNELLDTKRGSK